MAMRFDDRTGQSGRIANFVHSARGFIACPVRSGMRMGCSARSAQGDAFSQLSTAADSIMKASPDSPQAVQAQLVMAKLAYDKADYAGAEKALKKYLKSA